MISGLLIIQILQLCLLEQFKLDPEYYASRYDTIYAIHSPAGVVVVDGQYDRPLFGSRMQIADYRTPNLLTVWKSCIVIEFNYPRSSSSQTVSEIRNHFFVHIYKTIQDDILLMFQGRSVKVKTTRTCDVKIKLNKLKKNRGSFDAIVQLFDFYDLRLQFRFRRGRVFDSNVEFLVHYDI